MPLLLQTIGNFLAYVAALFVASVKKFSRTSGADLRTGDSKSPDCRIESATVKYLVFNAHFILLFIFSYRAAFCRFLASVCKMKLRPCVTVNITNQMEDLYIN